MDKLIEVYTDGVFMYKDDEKLKLDRGVGLTEECYKLVKKEKKRLKEEENRKLSMAKIVSNLIIKYLK